MKTGKLSLTALSIAIATVPTMLNANSFLYTVPATANIHSAGLLAPVDPGGGGAGTLPPSIALEPGDTSFTLSASGSVSQLYDGYYHGPDGYEGWGLNVYPYGGISGFRADVSLPLAAVFLSDATPQSPAPPTIDFRDAAVGREFATLSPQVGQIFFVGDGKYGSGSSQEFYVPAGATRLFLGYPDALTGTGLPGSFGENFGSLSVSIAVVPEPSMSALVFAGSMLFARRLLRKARVE